MKCENCGSIVPDDLAICSVCKKPVIAKTSDSDTVMCPCCGESNFKGIEICSKCGTPLAVPPENRVVRRAPQKRKRKKRLNPKFVAAVVIVFVIIAAAAGVLLFSIFHKDDVKPGKLQAFYAAGGNYTQFVSAGKKLKSTKGSVVSSAASLDGGARAVLTDGGKLYFISPTGVAAVSSNVVFCSISADGTAIPYLVDSSANTSETSESETQAQSDDETQTEPERTLYDKSALSLFLYDCAEKTSTLIANNVNNASVAVSPDGKAVSYTIASSDAKSFEGYICNGGIYASAGKNTCVAALSDNAEYVYYLKYESGIDGDIIKFFAKSAETETKLGEFGDAFGLNMYLNASASEVLFSLNGEDGNYFVSVGCAEKKRVSTGFSSVLPYGNQTMTVNGTDSGVSICPVETFAGTAFTDAAGALYALDQSFTATEVCKNVSNARISSGIDTLYFIDGSDFLYSCPMEDLSSKTKLSSHIKKFEISPDGGRCFYIDGDKALYCFDGKEAVQLGSDISDLWVTRNGTVYFLENFTFGSGRLCYSKNGVEKVAVSGADNVSSVIPDYSDKVYYCSDYSTVSGTFDLWYGSGNTFTKLFDDLG